MCKNNHKHQKWNSFYKTNSILCDLYCHEIPLPSARYAVHKLIAVFWRFFKPFNDRKANRLARTFLVVTR